MPLNHSHVQGHRLKHRALAFALAASVVVLFSIFSAPSAFAASAGAATDAGGADFAPTPATQPGLRATIASDGRTAVAPVGAPLEVQKAIWAANEITTKPYIYGGGHKSFKSRGYDCSGTVSYALHGGDLLDSPLDSSSFMKWGDAGLGDWITVYTNPGHAYAYIAGLRLDTSGPGERGPRWRKAKRSNSGFRARHPEGL